MDFDSILGAGRRKVAHKGQSHAILSLNQFSRSLALLVLALLMPVASQAMTFQSLVHETCKFRGEPLESYREESLSTCIDLTSGSIETTNLEGCGYWHVRYAAERWCRNAQPDDTCIGNPIQLSTLTKVQTETDYQTGGLFPVSIRRTYSSDSSVGAGAFGPGWHGDYERYMMLSVLDNGQYVLYIRSANGSEIRFNPSTGAFVTPGVEGKVYARPQVNNQQEWVYQKPDGSEDVYLSDGLILDQKMLLIESTSPTGDRKTFSYSNGRLATMTGAGGRTLTYTYDAQGRVQSITVPGGAVYQYQYDPVSGNLQYVVYPDNDPGQPNPRREYLYENTDFPHALTGIVDANGDRFATWGYDANGRAVLSEHAGGAERLEVISRSDYQAGRTIEVQNAKGLVTTYEFTESINDTGLGDTASGAMRLTSVTGASAPNCLPTDTSMTYDGNGNLDLKTDARGYVTDYDINDLGQETQRIEAKGTPEQRIIQTDWHPEWYKPSEIREPGKTTVLTYTISFC